MNKKVWTQIPAVLLAGMMMSAVLPVRGTEKEQNRADSAEAQNGLKLIGLIYSPEDMDKLIQERRWEKREFKDEVTFQMALKELNREKEEKPMSLKTLCYLVLAASVIIGSFGVPGYGVHRLPEKINRLDRV